MERLADLSMRMMRGAKMAEPNFKNRSLYHGDNLEFLRGMNSRTVHLIATDPPFKKGRDFHATPNSVAKRARFKDRWSWDEDVHPEWWDAIKDDWRGVYEVIDAAKVSYGQDMAAFLCWLGVRLIEMHRILRDDGSLYLHIDHTAHAYVKCLLDAIFGWQNFRNEIVWRRTNSKGTAKKRLSSNHDTILFYVKSSAAVFNADEMFVPYDMNNLPEKTLGKYRYFDGNRRYRLDNLLAPVQTEASPLTYEFLGITRTWRWTKERMQAAYDAGIVIQTKAGNVPVRKSYLDERRGLPLDDIWTDIRVLNSQAKERTGWPTQKPLALYERIIQASSNKMDFVLDPFCGCATTPVAAERLGRQWVGMDLWEEAYDIVLQRLHQEGLVADDESQQPHLIPKGSVVRHITPPIRSDDNEIAAPRLNLKIQRPKAAWERLSHAQIVKVLLNAQGTLHGVICAGCGRTLEKEFMELDHINPKSDGGRNDISNRILLCRPCNSTKRNNLTLSGLVRANKKSGWLQDAGRAKLAQSAAREKADWLPAHFDTPECQALIKS